MSDKGPDFPRQPNSPEAEQIKSNEFKIKPGAMVVVKRSDGRIDDGWMSHLPVEGKVMVSKPDDRGLLLEKWVSIEELTDLNRDVDPFRAGAWGINVRRSDGTVEANWRSRGQVRPGYYQLERPDGKGQTLLKTVRKEVLKELNS